MTLSKGDTAGSQFQGRLTSLSAVCLCLWLMHSGGLHAQGKPFWEMDGADTFLTFCAGCHGFDGFAEYPPAPSFAMGDRLQKDDGTLLRSVLNGKGGMPPWEGKLPQSMLQDAIAYLRVMAERQSAGLEPRTRPIPETWFKFRPVGVEDPNGWEYW